jgi:hypothetical protein
VLWVDDDRRDFSPRPESFVVPSWRSVDHLSFRRMSAMWRLETAREAINVNSLDEVPSSSWFENRASRRPISPQEFARGACANDDVPPPPWRVVSGKARGENPGFIIEAADGVRYVLKTDGLRQPERSSAADAISGAMFYAAGYHAPCNFVVYFPREYLVLPPGVMVERLDGTEVPLDEEYMNAVLDVAARDGLLYRAGMSRFVDGEPLGQWAFDGRNSDDPNDVIPHDRRREVRAMFLMAAWTGHWDLREQNTLASWIPEGDSGRGHVRHYLIDFDDSFGKITSDPRLAIRLEHQAMFAPGDALVDLATLGAVDRPWYHAELGPGGQTLGYYNSEDFNPESWSPVIPTPAFEQRTERDQAWMARIISTFSEDHIRAAIERGRFSDPNVERVLLRTIMERRERILERYLTRLSPLARPHVVNLGRRRSGLCLTDHAVSSGLRTDRRYTARAWAGSDEIPIAAPRATQNGMVCVALPRLSPSGYLIVDVVAESPGEDAPGPARAHFYYSVDGYELVGLQRPASRGRPQ